ncbi:hypothetical protein CEXT_274701 [Caerostris extrusa]|uniref:Uncharacterized protein n=1 Tax=Caerostris extrusa TaxID=172846 RepID=A0AAV4RFF5_CAEEX|nr:hypothetical protein CEXT_274701 [Caerostris extrusa]
MLPSFTFPVPNGVLFICLTLRVFENKERSNIVQTASLELIFASYCSGTAISAFFAQSQRFAILARMNGNDISEDSRSGLCARANQTGLYRMSRKRRRRASVCLDDLKASVTFCNPESRSPISNRSYLKKADALSLGVKYRA